jgi:hypothetical protein
MGWVIVQLKWIHERHDALDRHSKTHPMAWRQTRSAPWSLRIFGERGVDTIYFGPHALEEVKRQERERLDTLFPEADVKEHASSWGAREEESVVAARKMERSRRATTKRWVAAGFAACAAAFVAARAFGFRGAALALTAGGAGMSEQSTVELPFPPTFPSGSYQYGSGEILLVKFAEDPRQTISLRASVRELRGLDDRTTFCIGQDPKSVTVVLDERTRSNSRARVNDVEERDRKLVKSWDAVSGTVVVQILSHSRKAVETYTVVAELEHVVFRERGGRKTFMIDSLKWRPTTVSTTGVG